MASATRQVWLITGCSTGFGRELARQVLREGACAIVTARDPASVADIAALAGDRALPIALDVTDQNQIQDVVSQGEAHFGRVDVLVNNAGYGYQSTIEEGEDSKIRALFDTNVFGLFAMTRAVLPLMRKQRSGHIINITSLAGLHGFAASGYYAASKHAVEGFSDSLAAEGKPLGIQVTCVEPGPFRTDWAGRSLQQTPNRIADYSETAGLRMRGTVELSGKQAGNPERAARLIMEIAGLQQAPRNVALGARAIELGRRRLEEKLADIGVWKEKGLATDDM